MAERVLALGELAAVAEAQLRGDAQLPIRGVAPLDRAGPGDISFLANPKYRGQLDSTRAGAVIVHPSILTFLGLKLGDRLAIGGREFRVADELIREMSQDHLFDAPIVTEVLPLANYWPAEDYHQDFFEKNPYQGYCLAVAAPKVAKFRKTFARLAR